jgi:hypothetical protein
LRVEEIIERLASEEITEGPYRFYVFTCDECGGPAKPASRVSTPLERSST